MARLQGYSGRLQGFAGRLQGYGSGYICEATKSGFDLFVVSGNSVDRYENSMTPQNVLSVGSAISSHGLDATNGHIFYAHSATSSRLRRADLDGTNDVEILSSSDWTSPINPDIMIDPAQGYIFAAELDFGDVHFLRIPIAGGSVTTFKTISGVSNCRVALDTVRRKVYFSKAAEVFAFNYDGSGEEKIYDDGRDITGLTVDGQCGFMFIGTTSDITKATLNGQSPSVIRANNGTFIKADTSRKKIYTNSTGTFFYDGTSTGETIPSGQKVPLL